MLQLQRFTLDMQTFNRKKLNDMVSFPLYLNMNHFLDKETQNDEERLQKLIDQNPLNDVAKYMQRPKTFHQEHKELSSKADGLTDKEKTFNE